MASECTVRVRRFGQRVFVQMQVSMTVCLASVPQRKVFICLWCDMHVSISCSAERSRHLHCMGHMYRLVCIVTFPCKEKRVCIS